MQGGQELRERSGRGEEHPQRDLARLCAKDREIVVGGALAVGERHVVDLGAAHGVAARRAGSRRAHGKFGKFRRGQVDLIRAGGKSGDAIRPIGVGLSHAQNVAGVPLRADLHGEPGESCSAREEGGPGNTAGGGQQAARFEGLDRNPTDHYPLGSGNMTPSTAATKNFRKEFPNHLWSLGKVCACPRTSILSHRV